MKPVLVYNKLDDCTGIVVKDNTVLTSTPSFVVLEISLFDKSDKLSILIDNPTKLTSFLSSTPYTINSNTLGKTLADERLIELSCGLLKIDYHWFYQTSIAIATVQNTNSVVGNFTEIPDSIYLSNKVYTIDRNKSSLTKLVTVEKIEITISALLVKGIKSITYVINDCAIMRGHAKASSILSVLSCDENDCNTDEKEVDKLLRDLMILRSAYAMLRCNDYINANQLVKKLCNEYASECTSKQTVVSDCLKTFEINECSNCS